MCFFKFVVGVFFLFGFIIIFLVFSYYIIWKYFLDDFWKKYKLVLVGRRVRGVINVIVKLWVYVFLV